MATVYEKFAYQAKAIKSIESNLKRIRNLLGVADLNSVTDTTKVFPADITAPGTLDAKFQLTNSELEDEIWEAASIEHYIDPDTDTNEHKLVQDGSMCKLLGEMQAAISLTDIDENLKGDLEVIVHAFQILGFRPVPKS